MSHKTFETLVVIVVLTASALAFWLIGTVHG